MAARIPTRPMSTVPLDIRPILNELRPDRDQLRPLRETILANAVMIGEIPSPSGGEEQRVRFVVDRFRESQLLSISTDEAGNGVGVVTGGSGDPDRNILVVSHADTIADANTSHTMTLGSDTMHGAGIADNSIPSYPAIAVYLNAVSMSKAPKSTEFAPSFIVSSFL